MNKKKIEKKDFSAINLGYTMMAAIIILTLLGAWLDKRLNTGTSFTLGGILLGFFLGLYEAFKILWRFNKEEDKKN